MYPIVTTTQFNIYSIIVIFYFDFHGIYINKTADNIIFDARKWLRPYRKLFRS